jgi:hypothetical protein
MVVRRFLAIYPEDGMLKEDALRQLESGEDVAEVLDATVRGVILVDLEDDAASRLRSAGWRLVEETSCTPSEDRPAQPDESAP